MPNCTSTTGPIFDNMGNPLNPDDLPGTTCKVTPQLENCPTTETNNCGPFQLTELGDNCFIDSVVNESLQIGGAKFNTYKLLGVHEQCKLVDSTGFGNAISNGDAPGFPNLNAFTAFMTEWHSIQTGMADVLASAFIGYDFGEIKVNDESRRAYGIRDADIHKHITALSIKQSANPDKRVTKVRLERSNDASKWIGVNILILPDDDCLNTILFDFSVPSRFWRIRPLEFGGGASDSWNVQALQLFHNYEATQISNIQDKIWFENRNRDYADETILLKGNYDLLDTQTELSQFGIETPQLSIYATFSFSACVELLGRPLIIGDIMEVPSEAQFSAEMKRIEKWVEVTDVGWSTEGFTPGWQPTLLRVILQPAYASEETQDIFGDLASKQIDNLGLVSGEDGENPVWQDFEEISQHIEEAAHDDVPQRGVDTSHIRKFEEEEIQAARDGGLEGLDNLGLNTKHHHTSDAMPPNNLPFTEGDAFPPTPADRDYHRLTYQEIADRNNKIIPARLYRFSVIKGRWIYMESDKRAEQDPTHPILQEYLEDNGRVDDDKIIRGRKDVEECD